MLRRPASVMSTRERVLSGEMAYAELQQYLDYAKKIRACNLPASIVIVKVVATAIRLASGHWLLPRDLGLELKRRLDREEIDRRLQAYEQAREEARREIERERARKKSEKRFMEVLDQQRRKS